MSEKDGSRYTTPGGSFAGTVELREVDPFGYLDNTYLDSPEEWEALAGALRAAQIIGLDSEFYGLDVRKESCVGRARIHVWSVAVRTRQRSALGFHRATGWVLPVAAVEHPGLKAVLEDRAVRKCVHNQPVDDHSFHNHGIELAGCINTLDLARWVWPWLVTSGGFGLKNLMSVKLRRPPIAEFKDVVNDVRQIEVKKLKLKERGACSCGIDGCRKRKPAEQHVKSRVTEEIEEVRVKDEKYQHPLESILPGHPRWELLVRYAAEDAVAALEIAELADKERDPAPFPYDSLNTMQHCLRPKFNQTVCDAVVLMEREGFPIDVGYSAAMVERAQADEEKELLWLHKWFVVNGAVTHGPHRREEVDGIWSSPKQLGELFDDLEFPRSPIWKKGRVKQDEIKLDSTALKWVAKNCPQSTQVINHVLQLKKVRAGKKYMVKLANSGGWVNVICGPAGDADDRNGAVTGRLGIKGTLEAQQLPTKEEVDLYQVRKAIVAADLRTVA